MALNRSDVVGKIAEKAGLSKAQADAAVSALQEVITGALAEGESVRLTGFLTAERSERAARTGRNPRTGETLEIPAGYGVKLSAGSALKDAVKG